MRILWRLGAFLLPFCDYLKMSQVALEYSSYIVVWYVLYSNPGGIALGYLKFSKPPGIPCICILDMYLRYVLYDMSINSNEDIWY